MTAHRYRRAAATVSATALLVLLAAGCSDRTEPAAPQPTAATKVTVPPAGSNAPAVGVDGTTTKGDALLPPPAPASPAAPAASAPVSQAPAVGGQGAAATAAVQLPLDVQGVATVGLTVRVKGIELGEDATVLRISASFGGQAASYTKLAAVDTYLEDPDGNRLMLKRPPDNKDLKIMNGDTMEGQLVFLGRVPRTAAQVRLVINDGSTSDNSIGPGLAIVLPLKG